MRLRPAVLLVGVAAIALACVPPINKEGPAFLVGDSIARQLDPSGFSAVDGSGSRDYDSPGRHSNLSGLAAILNFRPFAAAGSLYVVQIGSNDVTNAPNSAPAYRDRIKNMIRAVGSQSCLIFVNVHRPAYEDRVRIWNEILRQEMTGRPCSAILDWYGMVHQVPGLVTSDQLHLTPKGAEAMKNSMLLLNAMLRGQR